MPASTASPPSRVLLAAGLAAWVAGAWLGHASNGVGAAFVGAGTLLILAAVFSPRMRGRTKLTPTEIDTNLAAPADLRVQANLPDSAPPADASLDAETLVAQTPTLTDALRDIPSSWTQTRIQHDDGNQFVHIKSPEAGFELVVNVAALDAAAPRWLIVAIKAMQSPA